MSQLLIMPINAARVTAGYLNKNYQNTYGYRHYGLDITDQKKTDRTLWGSGNGTVLAAGWDDNTGYTVIVRYDNVLLKNGSVKDVVIRIWHMESINVKKGQRITKDTKLGRYGNTGRYSSGAHCHLEIDTDVKYYNYTPSFAKANGQIIKAGINSTLNPADVLCVKTTSPDYQSIIGEKAYNTWAASDISMRKIK